MGGKAHAQKNNDPEKSKQSEGTSSKQVERPQETIKTDADAVVVGGEPLSSSTWLDDLSPEEREREEAKVKERQKKADAAAWQQKKQNEWREMKQKEEAKVAREKMRDEKKWAVQCDRAKARAQSEGVLEAEDWGDDKWWCKIEKDTYKEVQGQYYCTLCDKSLNDSTLGAHIDSQGHGKKLAWRSAPGKVADASHTQPQSLDHQKGSSSVGRQKAGHPPPSLPYLAWVPSDETNTASERWLMCLLCGSAVDAMKRFCATVPCAVLLVGGSGCPAARVRRHEPNKTGSRCSITLHVCSGSQRSAISRNVLRGCPRGAGTATATSKTSSLVTSFAGTRSQGVRGRDRGVLIFFFCLEAD